MKWVILITLPSGNVYAFAHKDRDFALVPVENGVVHKADAWDTREEAERHLQRQLDAAPKLRNLEPFKIERVLDPDSCGRG